MILDSGTVAELRRLGAAAVLPAAAGWAAAEVRGDDLADELLPLLGGSGPDGEVPAVTPEHASKPRVWTGWPGSSSDGPAASPSASRPGSCSLSRGRARP